MRYKKILGSISLVSNVCCDSSSQSFDYLAIWARIFLTFFTLCVHFGIFKLGFSCQIHEM